MTVKRQKIVVSIKPEGAAFKNAYEITFEHSAPSFVSRKLAENITMLLRSEYIAEGVKNIRTKF